MTFTLFANGKETIVHPLLVKERMEVLMGVSIMKSGRVFQKSPDDHFFHDHPRRL